MPLELNAKLPLELIPTVVVFYLVIMVTSANLSVRGLVRSELLRTCGMCRSGFHDHLHIIPPHILIGSLQRPHTIRRQHLDRHCGLLRLPLKCWH